MTQRWPTLSSPIKSSEFYIILTAGIGKEDNLLMLTVIKMLTKTGSQRLDPWKIGGFSYKITTRRSGGMVDAPVSKTEAGAIVLGCQIRN